MSTADDFDLERTSSPPLVHTGHTPYDYAVTHVFFPLKLPYDDDYTPQNDLSLARAVCAAAHAYSVHVQGTPQWRRITKMLDNLHAASTASECLDRGHVISQLCGMQTGDTLVFFIRPENAAIVLTKQENCTLFESFEVSPSSDTVEETVEPVICSYPSSAIETPNEAFDDALFQSKLVDSLSPLLAVDKDCPPIRPQCTTVLLTAILRDVGRTIDVPRIAKHVRDHVSRWPPGLSSDKGDWRRSSLWLLIRVAIQISADRSPLGRPSYKRFILFFICTLARDRNNTSLSSDLLHLMSSKILRRLSRLGSSAPKWLSDMALSTCTCLQEILDARWKPLTVCPSPFRNPSQDELRRDTQVSLLDSCEYIQNALADHGRELRTPLHPSHRRRGTIDDFLSSSGTFFEEAFDADHSVTLYDVEQLVEQGIDDWIACVADVDEACVQLEILMDKYAAKAYHQYMWCDGNPEDYSIMLLTMIELFIALDKLAIREIPMLADYSPDIPIAFLEQVLLRKATSLHRLARAYQYILARHSRSHSGWSVLSNEFTEDSFAIRYYNQSLHLQRLKGHIEEDTMVAGRGDMRLQVPATDVVHCPDGYQEYCQNLSEKRPVGGGEVFHSPLPTLPLHAKVVLFELHCPVPVRIWRSAAPRILHYFYGYFLGYAGKEDEDNLICHTPGLQRYFVHRDGPPLCVQIYFSYFYPGDSFEHFTRSQDHSPTLRYALSHPDRSDFDIEKSTTLSIWQPNENPQPRSWSLGYKRELRGKSLWNYVNSTSHTSNNILATQADSPTYLSLDEFVAFGHLRSGDSLQWLNILRGLRSRTLNFRHDYVHLLLAHAVSQVGPLDSNTGMWTWHQELQDPSFFNTLIDELNILFADVGVGSIDAMLMSTFSLLLTRLLASSPSEHISDRAIALLRGVRRKTFSWVQELSYNLAMAPVNEERSNLLWKMAATCRSTFDVDPAMLCKVLHSAEDVDALLSCAFLVNTLCSRSVHNAYSGVLVQRDNRLALALEGILRDVILADASDYGVDLAVGKVFASHKPSAYRWEQLQHPNARWLACGAGDQHSQTVYFNLLSGELRIDGQQWCELPPMISNSRECEEIFRDQGFFVIPSNMPGMDFTTQATMSKRKVHFSLRDDHLVIRAQCDQTNDTLELIPSTKLQNDLPSVLVNGHVHWLNLSTKFIEIRPLKRIWEESSDNWRIDCTSGQFHVYKGRETLVDIRSPTWVMFSECFYRLNNIHIHENLASLSKSLLITMSPADLRQSLQLSVALPRYELSFFVNQEGELESRDFKDMVYDENQCVGALFGLENLLILRQKMHLPEEFIHKRVLIPSGFPNKHHGDHRVRIQHAEPNSPPHGSEGRLRYHTYVVDPELGCLTGNGSLMSTLFLARLHAMTSCHRPDPLTGKAGVQAALSLLQSAACRSIMKLEALDPGNDWTSTQYPQIDIAYKKIQQMYYWNLDDSSHVVSEEEKCTAQRAAYLFPRLLSGPTPLEDSNRNDGDHQTTHRMPWQITLDQLFAGRPTPELPVRSILSHRSSKRSPDDILELDQLLSLLMSQSNPSFQRQYIACLNASAQCVREEFSMTHVVAEENYIKALEKHYLQCRVNYLGALNTLKKSLGPATNPHEQAMERSGQWPPITADFLLRCLASTSPIDLPPRWKKCLVSLAILLSDLQRARRLFQFALDGLEEEFSKELENEGYDGWNPEDYPEWLLIQVQGNFLIRRTQAETAMELMSPKSGRNTVMQVNMGEGKSSVIIPIAAAALADGKQLVRVIVPKPLTAQVFKLLVSRLGGLANRPIYHLPFSRSPEYDERGQVISLQIDDLHKLMSQCMAERGVLLVQPEHVASLQLMSVEAQIRNRKVVANPLPELQKLIYKYTTTALSLKYLSEDSFVGNIFRLLSRSFRRRSKTHTTRSNYDDEFGGGIHGCSDDASKWLSLRKWTHLHVRDILDESDEILHARFQLIYTVGPEQHMDGYPDRWTITQQVLRLVKKHANSLSRYAPDSIECERGPPGSFPQIRIVQAPTVGQRLISSIVEDVIAGRLPNFNFQHVSTALQRAVSSFISKEDILPDTATRVEEYAKSSRQSYLWSGLLLLRGLMASDILLFALAERRWRVDYGLVPRPRCKEFYDLSLPSTMLAVPYRAKDVPAPNTQFGHPDITITLTCLSYYYSGLNEEQLRVSFEILLGQDNPSMEYALWVKEYNPESLPESLQKLGEINLKSSEQWDRVVYPLFARNQATIDFYLSQVVFPKEAKEFSWKLSASSWDLAEKREKLVTGFSGTNDNQWLLPMSIDQRDPFHQQGSSARVLAHLLQLENDSYVVTRESGRQQTTLEFLQMVTMQQPEIRVLLDVGAQILDLSNYQVAKAWLAIAPDTAGAIYFNKEDELMVLTKSGTAESILLSPLSQQLDRCVVYLDHAHTRGTDIKFPIGSRAAVTLGPKVTKDNLVQGCMRMRKLGRGHSVMFFGPPEVDRSIHAVVGKRDPNTQITTAEILCWAIHETWVDIQRRAPYWAQQGMSHKSRSDAWTSFCNDELGPDQLSDAWLQPEHKSLADLYAPCKTIKASRTLSELDPVIRQHCEDLGVLSLPNAQMEEEQEREVNREPEHEREVELPPKAKPAKHTLHPDVVKFVNTGVIPPLHSGSAFRPVFATLDKSSAATREADVWSPFVLATTDFCKTIDPESTRGTIDQYLRPVQWVLSSKKNHEKVLVLLSPFEADQLMPDIRTSEYVHLHVYAPRTSQRMKPSDDLKLYSIPPLPSGWVPPWDLIDQLNVFSGQLYLRDYKSYLRLCRFLDAPTKESPNDTAPRWNLFNIPGSFEDNEVRFSGSPLPSVWALLAIRNRGRPFTQTHMGRILQGQLLAEKDFDRSSRNLATYDSQTRHDGMESMTPSASDMQQDSRDRTLPRLSKRRLETAGTPNADSEPPQKCLRTD